MACFGDLDDPTSDTDSPPPCFQQGVCNGVKVYCDNTFAADGGSGGPAAENYWWVTCPPGQLPGDGCNGEPYCCPGGQGNGACYCKQYSINTQNNPELGDVGHVCVGMDFPAPVDELNDWATGSYPTIDDEIRAECSNLCLAYDKSYGNFPDPRVCNDANWANHHTQASWNPFDGHDCVVPDQLNEDDPDGSEIPWDLVGGSSSPIPTSCDLDGDCVDWFYPDVEQWVLFPGAADIMEPETRTAHYLGVEGTGSQLAVDTPGGGPGVDDTESLFGMAEYTALDCGESVCPFFLANLSAYNTTDSWDIRVSTVEGTKKKAISNIQIDLIQSTLGVQNMALDVVAFAPGALRFLAEFTVEGTGIGAGTHWYVFENEEYVFADYDDGDLDLTHTFDIQGGDATLTVSVVPDEHPPVADHDLSATETCDVFDGLELRGYGLSTDPDNDIVLEMWWIDGVPCITNCVVPLGSHDVAIEAHDSRGAVDLSDTHSVYVQPGTPCAT